MHRSFFYVIEVWDFSCFFQTCLDMSNVGVDIVEFQEVWTSDVPNKGLESIVPIVWNSMSTEVDKNQYVISLGGRVNLLDVVFSLIPFLMELILPKKRLTMHSSPISRSAALMSWYCLRCHFIYI